MKVELKNVKINLQFSEETIMFMADIYVNGKKCGYANNDGRGGCTFYRPYSVEMMPLIKQAEEWAKSLPSHTSTFGDKTIEIKSNLENWIDTIVYDISNKKEAEKFEKRLAKNMLNNICYGNKQSYRMIGWKGLTIEKLLNHPQHRKMVLDKVVELRKNGETILNTNLPI